MKIYNRFIVAAFAAFAMGSCNDIIDIEPKASSLEDAVFSTLSGLESAVWGIYEMGRAPYESNDVGTWKIAGTDLVQQGSNLADQATVQGLNNYNFQLNAQNANIAGIWNNHYRGINRANIILKNLEALEVNENDPTEVMRRERLRGIALFFRAYFHLNLVQNWGNIELVTEAPDEPLYDVELDDPTVVYAQIEEDLLNAIEALPETAAAAGNGAVSKGVARHVLSKVYLDMEEWTKAAEMANAVINDPAYSLLPTERIDEIFSENFPNNSEVIFAWKFTSDDPNRRSRMTQQLIPLYDRINGIDRTFDYGGRPWARMYPSSYLIGLYQLEDARLQEWYITEYRINNEAAIPAAAKAAGYTLGSVVDARYLQLAGQSAISVHITPTTKKYFETDVLGRQLGDAEGFKNIIEYRLAEAYFVAAEAVMREPSAASALTGKLAGMSAVDVINVIRDRASVEPFDMLNQELLLAEHARELAHEGHRKQMLRRLGLLVERADQYNSPGASGNIQPYHVRLPIPQNFVQLTGVQQNPGYNQ